MENDPDMVELMKHADYLQGFLALRKAWLKDNKETWLSKEIGKSLKRVNQSINDLASYISHNHENVEVQIQLEPGYAKGKMLSTLIKRTDEWKSLKKYLKKNHTFKKQNITIRGLVNVILKRAKDFRDKI